MKPTLLIPLCLTLLATQARADPIYLAHEQSPEAIDCRMSGPGLGADEIGYFDVTATEVDWWSLPFPYLLAAYALPYDDPRLAFYYELELPIPCVWECASFSCRVWVDGKVSEYDEGVMRPLGCGG